MPWLFYGVLVLGLWCCSWGSAEDYVVVAGDTLFGLALQHDTDVATLKQINGLATDTIQVGQRLRLPASSTLLLGYPSNFRLHVVKSGETLQSIAEHYNISAPSLESVNPEQNFRRLAVSTALRIPPSSGFMTTISEKQNLLELALEYGLAPVDIVRANDLENLSDISDNQVVFVPLQGNIPLATAVQANESVDEGNSPAAASATVNAATNVGTLLLPLNQASAIPARAPQSARDRRAALLAQQKQLLSTASHLLVNYEPPSAIFVYPLAKRSRLSSPYGWRYLSITGRRFHHGIDLAAPTGMAILASKAGEVARAGYIGSYGNAVYINHADGTQTRYAHMSSVAVQAGQYVHQSEVIGRVGSTGLSTGPHLHFELRVNGYSVNPRDYLDF